MKKEWGRKICIMTMLVGMSVSVLGNEIQDNQFLLPETDEILQETTQEEIASESEKGEYVNKLAEIQEREQEGNSLDSDEIASIEEIYEAEIVEENKEEINKETIDEVQWEEILLEDTKASNDNRNIVAERMVIPLYEAIGHGDSGVDLSGLGFSANQLKNEFVNAIFRLGWMDSSITRGSVSYYSGSPMRVTLKQSDGISSLILYDNGYCQIMYTNMNYMIQRYNTMQSVVSSIMMEVNKANSELEKELIIHDYLVLNGQYDYDNYLNGTIPKESYSAYGLLVNHRGVCNSYAYAMKYLLTRAGIECEVVSGRGNGGGHAWNIVKIDGNYYYIDTTWDDPVPDVEGRIRYAYFNLSKEEMSKDHSWNAWEYPEANDNRYDVFREHENSVYYDGSIYYVEGDYDYTIHSYVSSIIRYDLAKKKLPVYFK